MRHLLVGIALVLVACSSTTDRRESTDENSSAVRPNRPRQDIREIRAWVPGSTMRTVVGRLGQPDRVFTIGAREAWVYRNAAMDPVTGQAVNWLEITFENRRAREVDFGY